MAVFGLFRTCGNGIVNCARALVACNKPNAHYPARVPEYVNYPDVEQGNLVSHFCAPSFHRNRYDQNLGRSKNAKGNSLRVGGSSHMRHGAGGGMRRGGRLGGQEVSRYPRTNSVVAGARELVFALLFVSDAVHDVGLRPKGKQYTPRVVGIQPALKTRPPQPPNG